MTRDDYPEGSRIARWAVLCACAVAVAGCGRMGDLHEHVERSETRLSLAPRTRLVIENPSGSVRLVGGGPGEVALEAVKKVRAREEDRAREIAREIRVEVERRGEELRVVVDYPRSMRRDRGSSVVVGFPVLRSGGAVHLTLAVPSDTPVAVESKDGDLFLDGFRGDVEFDTAGGDLHADRSTGELYFSSGSGEADVSELKGGVEMKTASGDLTAGTVTGTLRYEAASGELQADFVGGDLIARTASGDVTIGSVEGEVLVRSTSGDVSGRAVSGKMEVHTSSGDVRARIAASPEKVSIHTSSGDVRLVLPVVAHARIHVRTASGEIRTRFPTMAVESAGRNELIARVGAGGGSVEVVTSSGDVEIFGADHD